MKNKKWFVFDMDGTLLNSESLPLKETMRTIKMAKDKGHEVIIATGRPVQYIGNILDKFKLFDYYICTNGAYVYNTHDKSFNSVHTIPKSVVMDVKDVGQNYGLNIFVHSLGETFGAKLNTPNNDKEYGIGWGNLPLSSWEEVEANISSRALIQVTLNGTLDKINMAYNDLNSISKKYTVLVTTSEFIDVNAHNTNKYTGLLPILKKSGASIDDVVAFGDSDNDYELIKMAGLGIAMGNANDNIKDVADEVIGDNDSNAISNKLKELI